MARGFWRIAAAALLLTALSPAAIAANRVEFSPPPVPMPPPTPHGPPGKHGAGIAECGPEPAAVRGGDSSTACLPGDPGMHGAATVRRGVGSSEPDKDKNKAKDKHE